MACRVLRGGGETENKTELFTFPILNPVCIGTGMREAQRVRRTTIRSFFKLFYWQKRGIGLQVNPLMDVFSRIQLTSNWLYTADKQVLQIIFVYITYTSI